MPKISKLGWLFIVAFALLALAAVVVSVWGGSVPPDPDPERCIEVGKHLVCFY